MEFPSENIYMQWMDDDGEIIDATWSNDQIYQNDLVFRRDDAPGYAFAKKHFDENSGS